MTTGRATWGSVRVAWADAATSELRFDSARGRFGPQQNRRLAALNGAAADRFVVGRALLAMLMDELAGEQQHGASLVATCRRCGGEHGALRVRGQPVVVSVSYSGSMVAAAAVDSVHAEAVGVDIEREPSGGAFAPLASLAALFEPAAPPSTQQWTLLEAALKADGRGLHVDPTQCTIESGERELAVSIPGRDRAVPVTTVTGPPGFVLSVAAIAPCACDSSP